MVAAREEACEDRPMPLPAGEGQEADDQQDDDEGANTQGHSPY